MSDEMGDEGQGSHNAKRSITVLHIEDDTYVRAMTAAALPLMNRSFPAEDWPTVQVIEAEDGLTGVAKAKEHLPDVVLMDVRLPKLDGLRAAAEIRDDPQTRHIPIIFLTVFGDEGVEEAAARAGTRRVIQKPFRWDELMRAIVEVTDHHG